MKAINEIRAILLSNFVDALEESAVASKAVGSKAKVTSADELSFGEQLKAHMLAFSRSARFCDYPDGTRPGVPGSWSIIPGGVNSTQIGTSMFSKRDAIATKRFQVELIGKWSEPLIVQ